MADEKKWIRDLDDAPAAHDDARHFEGRYPRLTKEQIESFKHSMLSQEEDMKEKITLDRDAIGYKPIPGHVDWFDLPEADRPKVKVNPQRVAVFPGSFDPFTVGHKAVLDMALPLFDKVIVAIGVNPEKDTHLTTIKDRIEQIEKLYKDNGKVEVFTYSSLTAEFCESFNASFIIRGLRNTIDFEYEKQIAQTNRELTGIETVFFMTPPEYNHISSSMVRELEKHNVDIKKYAYSI